MHNEMFPFTWQQSNSEEHDNSTVEGGDLHAVQPETISGRELTNRRPTMIEQRRSQK
jgi:hypothetical protein